MGIQKYLLLVAVGLVGVTTGEEKTPVSYDGYKVVRFTPESEQQFSFLEELTKTKGVSLWGNLGKIGGHTDLLISPNANLNNISKLAQAHEMAGVERIRDVQLFLNDNNCNDMYTEAEGENKDHFLYNNYFPVRHMYLHLDTLAETYSNMTSVISIGLSHENREIRMIKISKPGNSNRPIIWLDANIHAREWITGAVAMFTIEEILTNPDYASWTDDFDFYIIPMANPDGYEYTRTDRLWRKTRRPNEGVVCEDDGLPSFGTDPNRNFPHDWNVAGTSPDPCAETYAGPNPFSELETIAISEYFKTIADRVLFFGSIHANSQFILTPYGGPNPMEASEVQKFERVGEAVVKAMRERFGTYYIHGSVYDVIYPATGGSIDWVKSEFDTYLVIAYELRDAGTVGFCLPPEQIVPNALEFLDGLQVIVDELRTNAMDSGSNGKTQISLGLVLSCLFYYLAFL